MSKKPQKRRKSTTFGKKAKRRKRVTPFYKILLLLLAGIAGFSGYDYYQTGDLTHTIETAGQIAGYLGDFSEQASELGDKAVDLLGKVTGKNGAGNVSSLAEIPEYTGEPYVTVNGNVPSFSSDKKNVEPYEFYSELDVLGRCGYAESKISRELMPTEERESIGTVKPSGWHTVKYDIIDGKYLYNRCHLIGYQLTAENANERNLITGTRYLNVTGMLPWENMVADYIKETDDQVMYRVTPIYEGNELVARGVEMEAESLNSDEIYFHIFVFNIQPGIGIDYANGNSWLE